MKGTVSRELIMVVSAEEQVMGEAEVGEEEGSENLEM
jgi:hypothetical protein